jgi:UDP-N-acetylmuramate--alanine ligase
MKIAFVGAGGSGMAAIVQWHLALHDDVIVSDDIVSPDALLIKYPGVKVWDTSENFMLDKIVFSDAIPAEHPLRAYAKKHAIPVESFSEELSALCEGRRVIAVAGTHGKSTTTALLSWAFTSADKDPLCVVGAEMNSDAWHGNFRWGDGPVVVEADEYKKHFLALHPETILITSLEMDHFDTYPDEAALLQTFLEFCSEPSVHRVFIARGQPMLEDLARELAVKGIVASRFGGEGDFVAVQDVRYENGICSAQCAIAGHQEAIAYLAVTCPHLSNLAGALAVLAAEQVSREAMREGVGSFPGIRRRMEHVGTLQDVQIYSDYAHHPTAVAGTLAVCKKIWPVAKIGVLFEPHERLRTSLLQKEYVRAFAAADAVGLLPVYDPVGRERKDIPDATPQIAMDALFTKVSNYDEGFAWMQKFADDPAHARGIIIIMGAGPIDGQIRKRILSAQL